MPITDQDDVNHFEALRVTALGVRIAAREARGLDATKLHRRSDQILNKAAKREYEKAVVERHAADAKDRARLDAKKTAAAERATRRYR